MRKAEKLRRLLAEKDMVRIVGAHNGMSAKLVEQAGFEGIWASGLEVSTSHGVPDANILTMSDCLRAASNMNESVSIPVIVDADTGYGNSNNVIYMVKQFEAAGIAAVCIEDKMFPKVNSFIPGRQELVPIAEFVGKIMAGKNAQENKDFCVFARVEALIAGMGMEEALKRARAYAQAGADGIFIHSKSKEMSEIQTFIKAWDMPIPLIICPTTYPSLNVAEAKKSGKVKVYIFANQGIRAAVKAMEETFSILVNTGDIRSVESNIASMKRIFQIQGMFEMQENEKKYLFEEKVQALIPLAGDSSKQACFRDILQDRPLAMLDINGKPMIQRTLETLHTMGITDIKLITGYCHESIQPKEISSHPESLTLVHNPDYRQTGILHSMMCAKNQMSDKVLMVFSDIIFERSILDQLLSKEQDITLVVDRSYREITPLGKHLDLVKATYPPHQGERTVHPDRENLVEKIGHNLNAEEATHEFIGIALFSKQGFAAFRALYETLQQTCQNGKFHEAESFLMADFTDIIQEMVDRGNKVHTLEINKGWLEIVTFDDYKKACKMLG